MRDCIFFSSKIQQSLILEHFQAEKDKNFPYYFETQFVI